MSLFHTNTLLGASGSSGSSPTYVEDVFSTFLYEGNASGQGANAQSITNNIDLSGEGGLVWIKRRDVGGSSAWSHYLFDTERGATKYLKTNETAAEATSNNSLSAFNSDGFTLGETGGTNTNGGEYVSWSFRKAPGFFDVVTYSGDGVPNRQIPHNLGSTPGMIIVKKLDSNIANFGWYVWHRSLGSNQEMLLNSTAAPSSNSFFTAVTSTYFSPISNVALNGSGSTYVAYIFAHDDQSFGTDSDEAIIKCDTVTISGSGTFDVNNLGFEPQFIIFKQISGGMGTPDWFIHDNMRGLVQRNYNPLLANENTAETANSYYYNEGIFTVNPQGFKSILSNHNAGDYIYIAIRRPHKPPTAGTDVFKAVTYSGSSSAQSVTGAGFAPDWMWSKDTSAANNGWYHDRLRGVYSLDSSGTGAEQDRISYVAQPPFIMDGVKFIQGGFDLNRSGSNHVAQFMKRAPGFFDIVCYDGSGSTKTVAHNLGATPQLIIFKNRSSSARWRVYNSVNGPTGAMSLNENFAFSTGVSSGYFNNTAPTSTQFTVATNTGVNGSGSKYVAYLFASLDGISKVGSYSGTGSDVDVDCGFSAGARYVLIKRTDSTGDWYVWDHARGIVSGNDPYLIANTTAAQTTGNDYIDPLNSGFTVTSSAPAELNASGGTYLFFAIA